MNFIVDSFSDLVKRNVGRGLNTSLLFHQWGSAMGFPGSSMVKSACQRRRLEFIPRSGRSMVKEMAILNILLGKPHGQRRLMGITKESRHKSVSLKRSPWGHKGRHDLVKQQHIKWQKYSVQSFHFIIYSVVPENPQLLLML